MPFARCCFCGEEIHIEESVDIAACHGCLELRELDSRGQGLVEYAAANPAELRGELADYLLEEDATGYEFAQRKPEAEFRGAAAEFIEGMGEALDDLPTPEDWAS